MRRAVLALVTPSTWMARKTSLLSSHLREETAGGGASGQVTPLPVCSCVCQLVLAAFPPAALHLLQSQQVHREQARHPLAAPLRLRADVQLEGADVTGSFLRGGGGGGRRELLSRLQLRRVSIAEVTWRGNQP